MASMALRVERRLRAVGCALQSPDAAEYSLVSKYDQNLRPEPYGRIPPECTADAPAQRLSDADVQRFIVDGFLTIQTPFAGAPVHESIVSKLDSAIDKMGNPGNNLLAVVPDIQRVFDHPAVRGAVESLLGPDAYIHPHCHCHNHQPGAGDQSWHKDEYNYDCTMRSPRCEWIFALCESCDLHIWAALASLHSKSVPRRPALPSHLTRTEMTVRWRFAPPSTVSRLPTGGHGEFVRRLLLSPYRPLSVATPAISTFI